MTAATYIARHGQGYSVFQHASHGITHELLQFVPPEDPIKISRLTLRNDSGRPRRLSVTAYVEWVLGSSRATAPYIITEMDSQSRSAAGPQRLEERIRRAGGICCFPRPANSYHRRSHRISGPQRLADCPAALERNGALSGKVGAGFDPCGALQTTSNLKPGAQVEIVFFLGQTENADRARDLLQRYRKENLNAVLRRREAALGRHAGQRAGGDSRSQHGYVAESLAALPDAFLPHLGSRRFLPGQRRVRLPRPAPGRDGAERRAARRMTRDTDFARRRASIHARRRAALVASAFRSRNSHPHVRRFALAAVRRESIHRSHRRHDRAGGAGSVSRGRRTRRRASWNRIFSRASPKRAPRFSSIARAPSIAA